MIPRLPRGCNFDAISATANGARRPRMQRHERMDAVVVLHQRCVVLDWRVVLLSRGPGNLVFAGGNRYCAMGDC